MNRTIEGSSKFGPAGKFKNVKEAIHFLSDISNEEAQKATIAFTMVIAANSTEGGNYFEDAVNVLNALGFAKAELDASYCHSYDLVEVTTDILSTAQLYMDENTLPSAEWPTSLEIVAVVLNSAMKYSNVKEWKKYIKNDAGAIIGEESIENK